MTFAVSSCIEVENLDSQGLPSPDTVLVVPICKFHPCSPSPVDVVVLTLPLWPRGHSVSGSEGLS